MTTGLLTGFARMGYRRSSDRESDMEQVTTLTHGKRLSERASAAVLATILGVFLILGVGFAQPDVLHSAAHDTRHALAFPCH